MEQHNKRAFTSNDNLHMTFFSSYLACDRVGKIIKTFGTFGILQINMPAQKNCGPELYSVLSLSRFIKEIIRVLHLLNARLHVLGMDISPVFHSIK